MARRRLSIYRRSPDKDVEERQPAPQEAGEERMPFDYARADADEWAPGGESGGPAGEPAQGRPEWAPQLKAGLLRALQAYDRVQASLEANVSEKNLAAARRVERDLTRVVRRIEVVLAEWAQGMDEARRRRQLRGEDPDEG